MTVTTNHTVTSASPQNWTILDSNSSDRSKLEDLARSSFLRLMPIIVLCALLAVLGTIGNSLSVYIFLVRMRRNFLNDLFILLSGTSLLACAFCLPGEIFDLYNPYIYPSLTMCKIGRYLNVLSTTCLVSTLWTLAVYRLKAAKASNSQGLPIRTRLAFITAILLWSTTFSLLGLRVYGIKTIRVQTSGEEGESGQILIGQDCAVADDAEHTYWPMIFNIAMAAGFLLLVITTMVCYYRIWRLVVRSRMAVAAHVPSAPAGVNSQGSGNQGNTARTERGGLNMFQNKGNHDAKTDKQENKSQVNKENEGDKSMVKYTELKENDFLTYMGKEKYLESSPANFVESTEKEDLNQTSNASGQYRNYASDQCGSSDSVGYGDKDGSLNQRRSVRATDSRPTELHHSSPIAGEMIYGKDNNLGDFHGSQGSCQLSNTRFNFDDTTIKISSDRDNYFDDYEPNSSVLTTKESSGPVECLSPSESLKKQYITPVSKPKHPEYDSKFSEKVVNDPITTPVDLFTAVPTRPAQQPLHTNRNAQSNCTFKKKASVVGKKVQKSSLESNITRTALLLAITFILCYVPFFCVSIPSLLYPDFNYDHNAVSFNLIHMAYRLYFVTPAINPLIFYASNIDFRRKLKDMILHKRQNI